jgi:type IV pilus assembly protein PilA
MKTNKKGFTLVELVIVIAVIAILAAVLLPTFSGIIARAKLNSATQRATSARDEFHSTYFASMADIEGTKIYVVKNNAIATGNFELVYGFEVTDENGTLETIATTATIAHDAEHVTKYGTDIIVVTDATIDALKVA